MSNLVIDVGNTRVKWGVFEHGQLLRTGSEGDRNNPLNDTAAFSKVIVCSVREVYELDLPENKTIFFDRKTAIPLQIEYETPKTLGLDRVAGAVGAYTEFPNTDCLLIDAGTCVTYDLITKKAIFKGGAIAPGLQMRLSSMHRFSEKLPKVSLQGDRGLNYPAQSTVASMETGALLGIKHEIQGYISDLKEDFPDLHVILTGGDASYFESKIKAPIFVRPEIILTGLNRILLHNEIHA